MDVRISGADDFRRLAVKFKAAGANGAAIRKKLTATIQKRLARIIDEQKSMAANMRITVKSNAPNARVRKGVKSIGGTRRREAFHQSARLRGRNVRARRGGYGLRASTARAIKGKVNYTGRKLGARVLVDPSAMPPSQRRLPRHLDNPRGWRHPTFHNRTARGWVTQYGEPYFSEPIERHRDEVRREIKADIDEVMRTLK